MVNSLNRSAKLRSAPSFDLDESDSSIPLNHQIDVAMSVSETPLNHSPATPPKPPLCYSLSEFPERLPGR